MAKVIMYEPGLLRMEHQVDDVRHEVAKAVAADARRYAPVDTGEMRSTIRQVRHGRRTDRVYVGTKKWYWMEYGTLPHIIEPKKKKALHWPSADHPVKLVKHPGTPEYAFMRRALYQRRIIRRF